MLRFSLSLLLLGTLISVGLSDDHHNFEKRSLLYVRNPSSRSRSSLPWKYLERKEGDSNESVDSSSSEVAPLVSAESEEGSASSEGVQAIQPVQVVPLVTTQQGEKGESGVIVKKRVTQDSESEEDEVEEDRGVSRESDFIHFSYYPIKQVYDHGGGVLYEIQDADLRTARGGGWGKGKKKKGCKKGKKGKGKKKGKKKKGKKGCSIKGGWWYYYDKKHGYVSGRWGSPPPKGLEREHYSHNFGKLGHGYGIGYDGHGNMGWKVKGWGGGHGHGGHGGGGIGGYGGGGYGGGGGGFGGFGGGGYGGGGHGGWGVPHTHYGWGWAEKVKKGWGWRR